MTRRNKQPLANRLLGSCGKCMIAASLLLALAGCNNGRIPITGTVTFGGEMVEDGVISMEPADRQGPTTGGKIINGEYELVGDAAPLPGKKTVRISAMRKTGKKIPTQFAPPGTMTDELASCIPSVYNTDSALTCEVSRDGTREIDFNLKSQ